jgi:hypothetical protein
VVRARGKKGRIDGIENRKNGFGWRGDQKRSLDLARQVRRDMNRCKHAETMGEQDDRTRGAPHFFDDAAAPSRKPGPLPIILKNTPRRGKLRLPEALPMLRLRSPEPWYDENIGFRRAHEI